MPRYSQKQIPVRTRQFCNKDSLEQNTENSVFTGKGGEGGGMHY